MKLIKLTEAGPIIGRSYSALYAAVKRGALQTYIPDGTWRAWGTIYTTRAALRAYQRAVAQRSNGWGGKRRGSGRKRLEKSVKPVTGL